MWSSEHYGTIKSLRHNKSKVIESDKSSVVFIQDYQDYVNKMMTILGDTLKFVQLGPKDTYNSTISIETKF